MAKKGHVRLSGKDYKTVALRVAEWRALCPASEGWGMVTDIVDHAEGLVIFRACILDPEQRVVATGHSSGSTRAQKAFEKLETVAVGRALAAFGIGGEEYASADEMREWFDSRENPRRQHADGGNPRVGDDVPTRREGNTWTGEAWKNELEEMGLGYVQVNQWLKANGKSMPWEMEEQTRNAALLWLKKEHVQGEVHRMFPVDPDDEG